MLFSIQQPFTAKGKSNSDFYSESRAIPKNHCYSRSQTLMKQWTTVVWIWRSIRTTQHFQITSGIAVSSFEASSYFNWMWLFYSILFRCLFVIYPIFIHVLSLSLYKISLHLEKQVCPHNFQQHVNFNYQCVNYPVMKTFAGEVRCPARFLMIFLI